MTMRKMRTMRKMITTDEMLSALARLRNIAYQSKLSKEDRNIGV
jgi:hypothetical protein